MHGFIASPDYAPSEHGHGAVKGKEVLGRSKSSSLIAMRL